MSVYGSACVCQFEGGGGGGVTVYVWGSLQVDFIQKAAIPSKRKYKGELSCTPLPMYLGQAGRERHFTIPLSPVQNRQFHPTFSVFFQFLYLSTYLHTNVPEECYLLKNRYRWFRGMQWLCEEWRAVEIIPQASPFTTPSFSSGNHGKHPTRLAL